MFRFITIILLKLCSLLALLLTILTTLLVLVFLHFDLDNYTETLAGKISTALQQPVSIGSSKLTFHGGIAIELQQIRITGDDNFQADIPKAAVTLEITPLLHGHFMLKEVRLIEPHLEVTLSSANLPAPNGSQQLLSTLGIDTLSIYNASLDITRREAPAPWDSIRIEKLNAFVRGWKTDTPGRLTLVGALPTYTANFSLEAELTSPSDAEGWLQKAYNGHLKLTHFDPEKTPALTSDKLLPQAFDLELDFAGIPADEIPISLKLFAASTEDPLAELSASWTAASASHDLTAIAGQLFDIPINGDIHFVRDKDSNHLQGRFAASDLDLISPELRRWQLPLLDKLTSGRLDHLQASFASNWKSSEAFGGLPPVSLSFAVTELNWGNSALQQLPRLTAEILLNKETLEIKKGGIITPTGDSINLQGRIESPFSDPQLDIKADGELTLKPLLQFLQYSERWSIHGNVPLQASISGTPEDNQLTLNADLSATTIEYGSLLKKKAGQTATLSLKSRQRDSKVTIEQINLDLEEQSLTASGYVDLQNVGNSLELSLDRSDLEKLWSYSPLLNKRKFTGSVDVHLDHSAAGYTGQIGMVNGSAYLTKVLGDLNGVSGTLHLDRKGMKFNQLKASLGESSFLLDGGIADWQQPQLRLNLSADKVRARDLFFRDETLILHDLSGRLLINGQGILFAPVSLRVEGNSPVTVTGELSDFKNPQIFLDVQGESANIMDIINLFTGPPKNPQSVKQKGPLVEITTQVKTGTLGDLRFENAQATISYANKRLDIFPLSFENGPGRCDGRVIFDKNDATAPLKVSGHIEDIDAQVIHNDFFKKPGLIKGALQGDFYIEGMPQDGFWKNARGGIGVQVRAGVLNRFSALSKVFSLLNVSQLFNRKLPDLKTEGMPFSLLEGSLHIANDSVSTDDLKITSEAMNLSLVGSQRLSDSTLDLTLGVMPLGTVDKVVSNIPIAGWILTGEEKTLVTAYFKIEGRSDNAQVSAIPIDSLSDTVFGIFKRTLNLPGRLLQNIGSALKGSQEDGEELKQE
jgi:hypothetical protein